MSFKILSLSCDQPGFIHINFLLKYYPTSSNMCCILFILLKLMWCKCSWIIWWIKGKEQIVIFAQVNAEKLGFYSLSTHCNDVQIYLKRIVWTQIVSRIGIHINLIEPFFKSVYIKLSGNLIIPQVKHNCASLKSSYIKYNLSHFRNMLEGNGRV